MSSLCNQHLVDQLCLRHQFALMAGHQQSSIAALLTPKNLLLIPVELVEKLPQDIPLHDILARAAIVECEDMDERDDDVQGWDTEEEYGRRHTSYGIDVEDTETLKRVISALDPYGMN